MSQRYVFTPGGLRRLNQKIACVRSEYQAVCDDNPAALEAGDSSGWHDNFAYEENQRLMHQLARRVRDLEAIQARAEEVPLLAQPPARVVLGGSVTWCYADEPHVERTTWIAGYNDGYPERGQISYNSPLGRALVGAQVGEVRELEIADRLRQVEILGVGMISPTADNGARGSQ